MNLNDVGDVLRMNPTSWRDVPPDFKAVVEAALLPQDGFAEDQRYWFARWWLECTAADVAAINAVLPSGTQVVPIEVSGTKYLGCDLLTDSLYPGQLYFPAHEVIHALVCRYFLYEPIQPVLP